MGGRRGGGGALTSGGGKGEGGARCRSLRSFLSSLRSSFSSSRSSSSSSWCGVACRRGRLNTQPVHGLLLPLLASLFTYLLTLPLLVLLLGLLLFRRHGVCLCLHVCLWGIERSFECVNNRVGSEAAIDHISSPHLTRLLPLLPAAHHLPPSLPYTLTGTEADLYPLLVAAIISHHRSGSKTSTHHECSRVQAAIHSSTLASRPAQPSATASQARYSFAALARGPSVSATT